jgi:membrane fusion protein (multidrug efflux system)
MPRPVAVRVATPTVTDLSRTVSYLGTARGRREVRVTARVPGTVAALPVGEGSAVRTGDTIAVLSAPDLAAAVERVAAEREYWCRHHDADTRLVQQGALPVEQAEASRRSCNSTTAALAEAEAQQAKTTEVASVNGHVLSWLVEPGQHVLPGQGLLLVSGGGLEVRVEVVEDDLRRGVEPGLSVVARVGDRAFSSTVSEIAPLARGTSRSFTVTIPVPSEHAAGLRVGASVGLDFVLATCHQCVAVPVEAIRSNQERRYVFLIRDGRAARTEVHAGIVDGGLVEVALDWNGRDQVAVSNLASLADGTPVFPVDVAGGETP